MTGAVGKRLAEGKKSREVPGFSSCSFPASATKAGISFFSSNEGPPWQATNNV